MHGIFREHVGSRLRGNSGDSGQRATRECVRLVRSSFPRVDGEGDDAGVSEAPEGRRPDSAPPIRGRVETSTPWLRVSQEGVGLVRPSLQLSTRPGTFLALRRTRTPATRLRSPDSWSGGDVAAMPERAPAAPWVPLAESSFVLPDCRDRRRTRSASADYFLPVITVTPDCLQARSNGKTWRSPVPLVSG